MPTCILFCATQANQQPESQRKRLAPSPPLIDLITPDPTPPRANIPEVFILALFAFRFICIICVCLLLSGSSCRPLDGADTPNQCKPGIFVVICRYPGIFAYNCLLHVHRIRCIKKLQIYQSRCGIKRLRNAGRGSLELGKIGYDLLYVCVCFF